MDQSSYEGLWGNCNYWDSSKVKRKKHMCWSGKERKGVRSLLNDSKYMDGSSYKGGCLAKCSSPLLFVGCSNSLKCGQFVPKDFSLLWKWEFTSLDEAVSALCQYLPFFGTSELPGNDGLHFYRALPCLVNESVACEDADFTLPLIC